MQLLLGDKSIATLGDDERIASATLADALAFPVQVEGALIGQLLVLPPPASDPAPSAAWANLVVHGLQANAEANYARHAVASETLESYREMALLQRAVVELNHSLKPAVVAEALLKEFDEGKGAADFGAVFLHDDTAEGPQLIHSFGDNAAALFTEIAGSRLFADMLARRQGDIINNLPAEPLWDSRAGVGQALLWLPLIAHGENLGLLVLVSRQAEGFAAADMKRAQALASVAATALRNAQRYAAEQTMFQSFVRVIATAIDAKSPYTAGHCRRVPEIALMLAEKAHHAANGPFASFTLDDDGRNALEIAAMLHDCGKVVTPEWVVDKATKLDSIVNRIELIALRFEILHRDALIERYRALAAGDDAEPVERKYRECRQALRDDFAFVEKCNRGGEFVSPEHIRRIETIAATRWRTIDERDCPLLDADEVYNLGIPRGTLNPEERKIIEDHAVHTIKMLSAIAFPRAMKNVVEYAACHHERMDGKGYPRGLTGDQLSIPARIMAIADIFEALTAPDRPYRKPGTLTWAIDIMDRMKRDGHIDGNLFALFLAEGVHLAYAEKYLAAEQIDHVDLAPYLS